MGKQLRRVTKWTPQKQKAFLEAAMALGAMAGISQDLSAWEVRLPGQKHAPIFLLYAEDLLHGVSWQEGRTVHHPGVPKDDIVHHLTEWGSLGALS